MNPLSPAAPVTDFVSKFTAATANSWRVSIAGSLDGVFGGSYQPLVQLTITGDGMSADPFDGYVRSGHTFHTYAGATVTFDSAITVNGAATFAGNVGFSGSINSVTAGTWGFYVDAYQLGGSTFHIGDSASGVGHLLIDGSGSGAGSNLKLKGNAVCEFETGTTLQTDSGASGVFGGSSTFNGTVLLAGATTQNNASFTKQGTNGYTVGRVLRITATNGSHNVTTPWAYDVISCTGNGTDTVNLSAPTGIPDGVCVRITANNGQWTIHDNGGAFLDILLAAPGPNPITKAGFVDIMAYGGAWVCTGTAVT